VQNRTNANSKWNGDRPDNDGDQAGLECANDDNHDAGDYIDCNPPLDSCHVLLTTGTNGSFIW